MPTKPLIYLLVTLVLLAVFAVPTHAQRGDLAPSMTKKVLVLEFNPILENQGNQRLTQHLNWNNPQTLESQYINDIKEASSNTVNYSIIDRVVIDDIPQKLDGFDYTDQTYLNCWNNHDTCHSPDDVDYHQILNNFQVCERRNSDEIDELWLWGGPWFGFYESRMTGPGAFRINSPPLNNTTCNKKMVIMGFNYERPTPEMLHNFGHRVEGTMTHLHGGWEQNRITNDWEAFALVDVQSPSYNYSGCGSIHYPPNATSDSDYFNTASNNSTCLDWENYPHLTGTETNISCQAWHCSYYFDNYFRWWLSYLPKYLGKTSDKWNNWWYYVIDYDSATNTNLQSTMLGRFYLDSNANGQIDEGDSHWIQAESKSCGNEYYTWPHNIWIQYGGPNFAIFVNTINNSPAGCNPQPYYSVYPLQPGTYNLTITGINGFYINQINNSSCTITSDNTASCTLSQGNNHTTFFISPNEPPLLPGDYDQDGDVDFADFGTLTSNIFTTNENLNLTGSNLLNIFDYNFFLNLYAP